MFIKRLAPNVYDVFVGNGWNQWTRVRRVNGAIRFVDGHYLSREALTKVKERLVR